MGRQGFPESMYALPMISTTTLAKVISKRSEEDKRRTEGI